MREYMEIGVAYLTPETVEKIYIHRTALEMYKIKHQINAPDTRGHFNYSTHLRLHNQQV